MNDSESIKKALTEELAACMAAGTAVATTQADSTDSRPHAIQPKERAVRAAAVAGSFYPASPELLATTIDQMLAEVPECGVQGDPIVLIAPHAGYIYSGPVAAHTYALLRGKRYKRVVVLAPSHREAFAFTSIYSGAAYATPLGEIPVDRDFALQLAALAPSIRLSELGHSSNCEGGEHAIEVQLPWLQRTLGEFEVVPVVMGDQSYESCRALGVALAALMRDGETLLLVSTDLSHFHAYDEAVRLDQMLLEAMRQWDYLSIWRNLQARAWEACGGAPLIAAMMASERLGSQRASVLRYANSGDTAGSRERVVGYAAAVLLHTDSNCECDQGGFDLQPEEKKELLALARSSIESVVRSGELSECDPPLSMALRQERAAFVSLHKNGGLRGCIGYTVARKPLYQTIREVAAMAAMHDPRFSKVTTDELAELDLEISVLSPLRRLAEPSMVQVGEHGLLVKRGAREGLLLPQVPLEFGWDRESFLAQTCQKAGLPGDSWLDPGTDIFAFTAVVFAE